MSGTVHVIGAGLAGLAAAIHLAGAGERVVMHDQAKGAGGRCRSYFDPGLGLTIDNGNHLLLSGNSATLDYLARTGAPSDALEGPDEAAFDFADLASGERWVLKPNPGRFPWWVLDGRRRVPGTRAGEYFSALGLFRAPPGRSIGEILPCEGLLYDRLWRPVLLAALNTDPPTGDAALAAQLLRETLGAGGRACRPLVAKHGLSYAFVEPALATLGKAGAKVRLGHRLRGIDLGGGRVERLDFGDEAIALKRDDRVVLAVPPWTADELLPGLATPQSFRAIVNAHFAVAPPPGQPLLLGVVNSLTEWLFAYDDRLSVTISGADRLLDEPREALAETIWSEVKQLTGLAIPLPRWQIVKERRATFAATPAQAARRPGAVTHLDNLILSGDWTATGLPATIEGAIRSGATAAAAVIASRTGAKPAGSASSLGRAPAELGV